MLDRRIKIRHMQALVEIARHKSLKRAAEVLNLTQPAISRTLKELEQIAAATLLDRGRGGVQMTAEGEVFLQYAQTGLTALDQAMTSVSALRKGDSGELRIGALPSVAARILPHAVMAFRQISPAIVPIIEEGPHGYLVDRLRSGALDLVIGRLGNPETMKSVAFTQLYSEDVVLVVGPDHPARKSQTLADIHDALVIYPSANAAIRPLVDRAMIAAGHTAPTNRIESVSGAFGRALTLDNKAIWVISAGVVAHDIAAKRLFALPIDLRLTSGPVGIMARAEEDAGPVARAFRQALVRATDRLDLN